MAVGRPDELGSGDVVAEGGPSGQVRDGDGGEEGGGGGQRCWGDAVAGPKAPAPSLALRPTHRRTSAPKSGERGVLRCSGTPRTGGDNVVTLFYTRYLKRLILCGPPSRFAAPARSWGSAAYRSVGHSHAGLGR